MHPGLLTREVEAQTIQALAERQCMVKLPRLPVSSITVPDVREPFVRLERTVEFDNLYVYLLFILSSYKPTGA